MSQNFFFTFRQVYMVKVHCEFLYSGVTVILIRDFVLAFES